VSRKMAGLETAKEKRLVRRKRKEDAPEMQNYKHQSNIRSVVLRF
jgi:hypothetical protein